MGRKAVTLPDSFLKKIDKATTAILNKCAKKMATDCKEQYRSVIRLFYSGYPKPHSYDRTLETLNANNIRENNFDYKKITTRISPTAIRVVFSIGTEFIKGKPYRADTDWVFNRTFKEGIHGWTPEEVADYTGGSNYGYYGKDGRFYMNRMMYWYDVPQPMSPTPYELMDSWYKNYRQPYNLKDILLPIARETLKKYI